VPARTLLALLAVAALAVAGCGGESEEKEVRSTLDRFASATASKDYQTICDLLSRDLVDEVRKVNLPCEVAFKRGLEDVEKPSLRVQRVVVDGKTARATVRSSAANQQPSEDEVRLVKEEGEWRVASLASPSS
jgi:hypothetical protein